MYLWQQMIWQLNCCAWKYENFGICTYICNFHEEHCEKHSGWNWEPYFQMDRPTVIHVCYCVSAHNWLRKFERSKPMLVDHSIGVYYPFLSNMLGAIKLQCWQFVPTSIKVAGRLLINASPWQTNSACLHGKLTLFFPVKFPITRLHSENIWL